MLSDPEPVQVFVVVAPTHLAPAIHPMEELLEVVGDLFPVLKTIYFRHCLIIFANRPGAVKKPDGGGLRLRADFDEPFVCLISFVITLRFPQGVGKHV
jgi:hypothetical protein